MKYKRKMAVLAVIIACAVVLAGCAYMKDFLGARDKGTVTALDRKAAEAHYLLATYYQKQGRNREALEELSKAGTLDPGSAKIWNAMGVSYDRTGDFRSAVFFYEKAIGLAAVDPLYKDYLDSIYNNLGYSYLLQKNAMQAADAFKKAIILDPANKLAHNNLALAYAMEGRFNPAFEEFRLASGEASAHLNMARIYYERKLFTEAKKEYSQALGANPSSGAAKAGLEASNSMLKIEKPAAISHITEPLPNARKHVNMKSPVLASTQIETPPINTASNPKSSANLKKADTPDVRKTVSVYTPAFQPLQKVKTASENKMQATRPKAAQTSGPDTLKTARNINAAKAANPVIVKTAGPDPAKMKTPVAASPDALKIAENINAVKTKKANPSIIKTASPNPVKIKKMNPVAVKTVNAKSVKMESANPVKMKKTAATAPDSLKTAAGAGAHKAEISDTGETESAKPVIKTTRNAVVSAESAVIPETENYAPPTPAVSTPAKGKAKTGPFPFKVPIFVFLATTAFLLPFRVWGGIRESKRP